MSETYDPKAIEEKWQRVWDDARVETTDLLFHLVGPFAGDGQFFHRGFCSSSGRFNSAEVERRPPGEKRDGRSGRR